MSKHPLNLAIRFILEVIAIITFGIWGFGLSDSWSRILLAILFPLVFALLWGVFAVPNDPSRSGKTVVATPGIIRLFLELALFGSSIWMQLDLQHPKLALIIWIALVLHYIFSYDRIIWLLKQK
jgi:hypothetical protein